ncbi:MAG: ROK family protein [Ruminococcaceae bacterium]|nr:ROK family protein [Oscillospiraceae bacterium]
MKYYLGMDIGGTKCAVVLSEKNSKTIKDKIRFETKVERGYKTVIAELISSAEKLLEKNSIPAEDVLACGVSCGGPLNSDTGVIMRPPNLPDWDNVPLADMITESLGIPCKIRNDADACALAEWQFGAGKGAKNMIFLTFGTGMGAGLILDGKLYSGTCGTAGEVGHIRLDADGPAAYGKAGSFEGFCSGAGIAAMGKKMLSIYNGITSIPRDNVTAKTIADAAINGDKLANAIYRRCGEKLGLGLSILIDILNPEKIVIGSIFQRSGHLLIESMNEVIKKEALAVSAECCEIVPAMLGDEIGDYAAIGVAKDFAEGKK